MGAGSSTGKTSADYANKAALARVLSDEILTAFFKNTDYKDILSLANLSACPKYVFTTADALATLFEKVQVYPKRGKDGVILLAPISALSPSELKGDQKTLEKTIVRNNMCLDVAYYYVRIFQIYAALALTVLDTNPTRRISAAASQAQAQAKAQAGWLFSGGAGLGLTSVTPGGKIRKEMAGTPAEPLADYFLYWNDLKDNSHILKLIDTSKSDIEFFIIWVSPSVVQKMNQTITLKGIYKKGSVEREVVVDLEKETAETMLIRFKVNNSQIFEFTKSSISKDWIYSSPNGLNIVDAIKSYYQENVSKDNTNVKDKDRRLPSQQDRLGFSDFDIIKKQFQTRAEGKPGFPKAYCTARIMTLLNPIFKEEKTSRNPVTQICKTTLDFEVEAHMPRTGSRPDKNIYLKSLVGLYYDEYELKANQTEITFKKSQPGKEQLEVASAKLAKLYGIAQKKVNTDPDPRTFLESGISLKVSSLCNNYPFDIEFDKQTAAKLEKEVILPMLKLQENHTIRVNNLLKKMFDVRADKGAVTMHFQNYLKNGGIPAVNEFGKEARELLLDYYYNSEHYFIYGIKIIEQGKSASQLGR
jgi:hypothetical protein